MSFEKQVENVYRLKVPFDGEVYTSVFLIKSEQGNVLVDCATHASDIDEYILPALRGLGLTLNDIKYLILTHKHSDHSGGETRILELAPDIEIIQSKQSISLKGIIIYEMKGHTQDCIGVLDISTGTLISGDGLQGYGVGKYRCSLESKEEYLKTINKVSKDERVKNILFSHAYEPWNKDAAFGCEEVKNCLNDCIKFV